jgi:cytidyltransferase-like protein
MAIVMIAGDFGKLHAGHLDHILKAAKLGDFLIVITHPDAGIRSRKGYDPDPLEERIIKLSRILNDNKISGMVGVSLDSDGTVKKTLESYLPNIFAKGGDRRCDADMPPSEVKVCKRLGIEIRYGIGDKLGESRQMAKPARSISK